MEYIGYRVVIGYTSLLGHALDLLTSTDSLAYNKLSIVSPRYISCSNVAANAFYEFSVFRFGKRNRDFGKLRYSERACKIDIGNLLHYHPYPIQRRKCFACIF